MLYNSIVVAVIPISARYISSRYSPFMNQSYCTPAFHMPLCFPLLFLPGAAPLPRIFPHRSYPTAPDKHSLRQFSLPYILPVQTYESPFLQQHFLISFRETPNSHSFCLSRQPLWLSLIFADTIPLLQLRLPDHLKMHWHFRLRFPSSKLRHKSRRADIRQGIRPPWNLRHPRSS